jgi:hypothetical protein
MRAWVPVPSATYQEARTALNWPLLTCGLFAPVAAEIVFLVLAVTVNPVWVVAMVVLPFFAPVLIYISLLYRNWPTGIRIDATAISIGAVGSSRATRRTPTVNHQSWGLFTCPWSGVEGARVVTDRAEVRRLKTSSLHYTLNNRWGTARTMTHCNIGVLTSPFMRAALVLDIDPTAVTATPVRPARFYSNFKNGRFSRLLRPELSSTWIVPTRDPEALRRALEDHPRDANLS